MIAKGKESTEPKEFKRYIGVASVKVVAINPDKVTHEKLFNTTLEAAPVYTGKVTIPSGEEVDNARIGLVFQLETKDEMTLITSSLFIQNRVFTNKDNTKVQVIDKYGNTGWVTKEDFQAKRVPNDKNGNPLNIDADYRAALIGEAELMNFVREYLCIPSPTIYDFDSKKWVPNSSATPAECECRFENLVNIFKGDFSDITDALSGMPDNKVKVMLGVRTDANSGKMYQTVYTRKFVKNNVTNMTVFKREIKNMIDRASISGRAMDTEYEAVPVHEYKVTATTFDPAEFSAPATEDNGKLPWE